MQEKAKNFPRDCPLARYISCRCFSEKKNPNPTPPHRKSDIIEMTTYLYHSGGQSDEHIEGLFHGFPLSCRHEHPGEAETSLPRRRPHENRHGEKVRRDQDAFRRARQPRLPAPAVREDRRRSREGAGGPPVPHGLQHALPRQPQARARAHGLRESQRLQHDHDGLPDHHRRRAQGNGRRRGPCEERRVHQGSEDRPRRHGRRRLHQPRPFQGA